MQQRAEQKKTDLLTERGRKILAAVVKDYILTAEPVGSKAVSQRYALDISPATIRNIMAELESAGFLVQPHTSAGRIPTEKTFRLYVDSLLETEEPEQNDKKFLRKSCGSADTVDGVFTGTTRALSMLTNCAGLVFVPKNEGFTIKHIRLLPMDNTGLMVIIVSSAGMVRTRLVRLDEDMTRLDLERISNYLNAIGAGLTIRGLRSRIAAEMKKEKNLYDELLGKACKLGVKFLREENSPEGKDLYVEGRTQIFQQPEFRDNFDRLKEIFAAFEEKSLLVRILDRSMEESGVQIHLGSESSIREFDGLSFVTAPCARGGEVYGTLGVIGPVRMNYARIIPLVAYTAGLLSKDF
ncbi:MAG: heat-inducible transcription repressor HrcA [Deltaproteobacteria bacterium]|nr:heat-inducible transcription repressor HrcA [Deltaproteobacteria bacterium]